ncbi:hypothetical protein ABEW60_21950 [Paenibacillus jamilae]|uniref:hypothetical protein n=1 Tax=Paenibacillus jamilae TaxID=114136 RepID=UPI003D2BA79F
MLAVEWTPESVFLASPFFYSSPSFSFCNTFDGYLEKHELAEFLNAVNEHGLPDDIEIFHLLAFSGMRSGELCALKDTDFNFELNELRITKTLYNPDNNMRKYTLTPPKFTGSIRKFNIIDNVMNLLQRHIVKQQALRLEYKKLYHENNFVFAHKNGYPITQLCLL